MRTKKLKLKRVEMCHADWKRVHESEPQTGHLQKTIASDCLVDFVTSPSCQVCQKESPITADNLFGFDSTANEYNIPLTLGLDLKNSSKQSQAIIDLSRLSDVLINNFKHAVSDERTISKEETNNSCVPVRPMLLTNSNDMAMEG